MSKLVAELTSRSYAVELPAEEFLSLTRVEDRFAFMRTLGDRMDKRPGISQTEYNGHFGSAVYFDVEEGEGNLDDALALIEDQVALCVAVDRLVPDYRSEQRKAMRGDTEAYDVDPNTVRPFFSGPGFVFCDRGDLGVVLHFRSGGEACAKWFTDGAAEQWRELCSAASEAPWSNGARKAVERKAMLILPDDVLEEEEALAPRP